MAHVRTPEPSRSDPTALLHAVGPAPAGRLRVVDGGTRTGAVAAVDARGTVLGRDAASDLVLDSEHVSRRHAIVVLHDGEPLVRDLGSANGTRVNGRPVDGAALLHDGDRITVADVTVAFERDDVAGPSAPPRDDVDRTATTSRLGRRHDGLRTVREDLHRAPGFSALSLLLAVGGSVVATVLSSALGTGQWGTLAAAAIGPVVSTTFSTTKGRGGGVRLLAIVVLSGAALAITVTGVSLADRAAGHAVLGDEQGIRATFPVPGSGPTDPSSGGPDIRVDPEGLDCGTAPVGETVRCGTITVLSSGETPLEVGDLELLGDHAGDFAVVDRCGSARLSPGAQCRLEVEFAPTAAEARTAALVIHQNLPAPDQGTRVEVVGQGRDLVPTRTEGPEISAAVADG